MDDIYNDSILEREAMANKFITRDSGKREDFDSGMTRDTEDDKIDYSRVFDGPMLQRWAELLTRGAKKYPNTLDGKPNWMKANSEAELRRFKRSAFRHFVQLLQGDETEDHAAAVVFNLNGYLYVQDRLKGK